MTPKSETAPASTQKPPKSAKTGANANKDTAKKTEKNVVVAASNGASAADQASNGGGVVAAASGANGKRPQQPNKIAFNQKIEDLTKQIDATKAQIDKVKEAVTALGNADGKQELKQEINDKIAAVRAEQEKFNDTRNKLQEQLKIASEVAKRKADEIKSARDKLPFRSTAEIDRKIADVEAQVASGSFSMPDERRLLGEISTLRKHRKTIESLGPQEGAIEADRKKVAEIRKKLDALEPEGKNFKKQLDELFAKLREVQSERSDYSSKLKKLRSEREELSQKMAEFIQARKEAHAAFNKERDEYYKFVKEERARKQELYKKQKQEQARQKKLDSIKRVMEEAKIPAYQTEISSCGTLAKLLQSYIVVPKDTAQSGSDSQQQKAAAADISVSNVNLPKGVTSAVALKKKSDRLDEDLYLAGKKPQQHQHKPNANSSKEKDLRFDFEIVNQFMKLNITIPTKPSDLPKIIQELEEKKKYFKENQERVTKENMDKAKKYEEEVMKTIDDPVAEENGHAAGVSHESSTEEEKVEA